MTTPRATPARFPAEYGQTPETIAELLTWEEVAERIAASPNYFLATTTDEGRPYLRPVDGVFVEAALAFGGSPGTRWVHNLQHRPEVSASLPDDDHAVILEGRAELVTDADLPLAAAVGSANVAKYPQYYGNDTSPEPRPFWALRPRRVYAWSLTSFPRQATRFDFD
jgi:nitroimidazol reductase NimA-like FMN-containing flavoprotein (pyridoxamine 5'-phosphate oxidase superfamily)